MPRLNNTPLLRRHGVIPFEEEMNRRVPRPSVVYNGQGGERVALHAPQRLDPLPKNLSIHLFLIRYTKGWPPTITKQLSPPPFYHLPASPTPAQPDLTRPCPACRTEPCHTTPCLAA